MYGQSPGSGARGGRGQEKTALVASIPRPEESCEGMWLLSLESERSLLNSLDFPSQPSRERVRLGNVSSEQVLLKASWLDQFPPRSQGSNARLELTPPLPRNSPRNG